MKFSLRKTSFEFKLKKQKYPNKSESVLPVSLIFSFAIVHQSSVAAHSHIFMKHYPPLSPVILQESSHMYLQFWWSLRKTTAFYTKKILLTVILRK